MFGDGATRLDGEDGTDSSRLRAATGVAKGS